MFDCELLYPYTLLYLTVRGVLSPLFVYLPPERFGLGGLKPHPLKFGAYKQEYLYSLSTAEKI